MRPLLYDLYQLCRHNKDGSYLTQANRLAILRQIGEQLLAMGYTQLRARDLKGRHIDKLLTLWRQQALNDRTIANRLSILRWLCEKIDRVSIIPKTNAIYELAPRPGAATVSKAWVLDDDILNQVTDPCIRMSFALQRAYGLRRKESLLLRPWRADQGDHLTLEGSWCKNGRSREVPILCAGQREVLNAAKELVRFKSASLIPRHLKYHQQRNIYDATAKRLALNPLHGLRHCYAQKRYMMLSGIVCPVLGGPSWAEMTPEEREKDLFARKQVSNELGHGRISIVGLYIGAR